jgi:hypothetical protein
MTKIRRLKFGPDETGKINAPRAFPDSLMSMLQLAAGETALKLT